MKAQIDRELVKQVANCKNQPRNFLFIPGKKQSVLVIDKKPISSDMVKNAKKKAENPEGTGGQKGLCFRETDTTGKKTLVFLIKKKATGLDRQLRKCLKENAGVSSEVEVRLPSRDQLDHEGNIVPTIDNTPDSVEVPKKASEAQLLVAQKAMYKKALAYISKKIGEANTVGSTATAQLVEAITPLMEEAERLAGDSVPEDQRDYKQALKLLVKAKKGVDSSTKAMKPKGNQDKIDADFEAKLKDAKVQVQTILRRAANSAAANQAKAIYLEAAKKGRLLQFQEGTQLLDQMLLPLKQIVARMDSYNSVYADLMNLDEPACSPHDRGAFDGDFHAALGAPLDACSKNLLAVEDRMRRFLTDRKVFIEAANAVQALIKEARTKVGDKTANLWEQAFRKAFTEASAVGIAPAYDAMTRLDAHFRKALRMVQGTPKSPPSENEDVDTESTADELLGNKSPEVRQMKFKMNVDNLRRALVAVNQKSENLGKALESALNKITNLAETDFDQAEKNLEAINVRIATILKNLRARLEGKYKQEKMEEQAQENAPRGRFARHRENPNLPKTTVNWSRDIERRQILNKVVIGKEIGVGGFGKVHFLDPVPNTDDEIPPLIVKIPTSTTGIEEMQREAEIYKKVGDHPNIPKCLGLRDVAGKQGLVLERVQGRDFDKVAKDLKGKLEKGLITHEEYISTFQYTLAKMMDVLAFLHDKGLTHNDLKGPNIMIDEVTGEPKVIDLGTVQEFGKSTSLVDNPRFKAPENIRQGQVSSPQTDTFSAGGVAYNAMSDQANFHFQDVDTLSQDFMSQIEVAMEAYNQSGSDEGAIAVEDENNPAVRKVNEFGQEVPDGKHLRKDPSRAKARSNFTDFMNLILHPDPKKRLTPKEALQHPFLRDPLLSEEQIKAVFTRKGEEPSGVIKTNNDKRFMAKKDLSVNKEQLQGYSNEVKNLVIEGLPLKDLPAVRQQLAHLKMEFERLVNFFDVGSQLLGEIVRSTADKNSEQFFTDNRMLAEYRQIYADALPFQIQAQQMAQDLDRKLGNDVMGQVNEAKAGTMYDETSVNKRKQELASRIATTEVQTGNLLINLEDLPGFYDKALAVRRFAARVDSVIQDLEAERLRLTAVVRGLEGDPEGGEAAARCRDLLKAVEDCRDGIQEKIRPLAPALDGFYNAVVAVEGEVNALVQEGQLLGEQIDAEKNSVKGMEGKLAEVYGRLMKMPRTTVEEIAKFDLIKGKYDGEVIRHRGAHQEKIKEMNTQLKTLIVKLQEKQMKLGEGAPPTGFPNVTASIKQALTTLTAKGEELAKVNA